ncbi:unnamed protein product [Closterium sp. Naga37s-1]|nr:unnamed protein product [Closterium sp. Naga37s-1]
MDESDAVDMLPAPLWHHIFRRLLLPPSQPDDPAVIAEDRDERALRMQRAAGAHLRGAVLRVSPDPDCTGSERHRRDADKYGASWPLLCCALACKSLLQHVLSFSPISLICNHHYPQWMDNIRFFLHHRGLHSLDLTFTKPEHLHILGPLIARSSASLTSLDLELHVRHGLPSRDGFTLGFLKDYSQLQQLKLGRGEWKLNESCANAAWMQSLRCLTLAHMDRIALEYDFLDSITPQLTEFTFYEARRSFCLRTISHRFSFSNVRILRFLFLDCNLKLNLNLPPSLTTLSVMADFVQLTCHSDSPFALHQLILYAHAELHASLLCFASARVICLNVPARYAVYHSLEEFSTEPPSPWQDNPSASSNFSWMSWLRKVAPTVEVLIIEHEVPFTKLNVEWHSLRSLGIFAQYTEVDDDGREIEKDWETSVEDIYRLNMLDEREFYDGTGYADDPDLDKLTAPPCIKAPNLHALFFPSEGSDEESLSTLKRNYPLYE